MNRRSFLAGGVAITAATNARAGNVGMDAALSLIGTRVVVIARAPDPKGNIIVFQDFVVEGEDFIPIFSDPAHFKTEAAGSGFEHEGTEIDLKLFVSVLRGDELLVLNPASTKLHLRKSDLQALLKHRGE